MSTLVKDANWLDQLRLQDVRKAHTQLQRARSVAVNPWTQVAGSPTAILTEFLRELVNNHVEITQRAVAIKAQAQANHVQQERHRRAHAHACEVLEGAVSHRLLARAKFGELQVQARAQNDIQLYRMLSEAIRALNLQSDADFHAMYRQAYQGVGRQRSRIRQLSK